MRRLKQSTVKTVAIGPFYDRTTGNTIETGLSIAYTIVKLSKDGGTFAAKANTTVPVHNADGWYLCPLGATDTNTAGELLLQVNHPDALEVWHTYEVSPANVFDSLAGTDNLQVDVTQIGGAAQSATDLKDFADTGYSPASHQVVGVGLVDTATTVTNTVDANLVEIGGTTQSALDLKDLVDTGYTPTDHKIVGVALVDTATTVTNTVDANLIKIGGTTQSADDLKDFADTGYSPVSHQVVGVGLVDTTTAVTNAVDANLTKIGGTTQSAVDLKDFVDTGYSPGVHKVVGVLTTDTATTVTNAVDANLTKIGGTTQSMTDLKDFVDTGYSPAVHKVVGVVTTDVATTVTNPVDANVTKIGGTALDAAAAQLGVNVVTWAGEGVVTGALSNLPSVNVETMWDTSAFISDTDFKLHISGDTADLSTSLSVNAKKLNGETPVNFDPTGDTVARVTLVDSLTTFGTAGADLVADHVWDEASTGHTATGTMGGLVNSRTTLGAGGTEKTYTVTDGDSGLPIANVSVWVTTDAAGSNVVASGTSDVAGEVTFMLDNATYYIWRQKSGYNFTNPDTETVP